MVGRMVDRRAAILILLLSVISQVQSQDCPLPANYTDVRWYETFNVGWTFTYSASKTLINYYTNPSGTPTPSTCTGSNITADAVYFSYNLFFSTGTLTCNRAVQTDNQQALLLSRATPAGGTGLSSCLPAFTQACYDTNNCAVRWLLRGTGSPVSFSAAVTSCPVAAGTYGLTLSRGVLTTQCTSTVTVTATQIIVGPCMPSQPGVVTPKSAIIYNGTTLTCMGNMSATALIATAATSSPSLLLLVASNASGQGLAMYCARYAALSNGVNITLDVSTQQGVTDTRSLFAACGAYGAVNSTNQFLSLTLGPVFTTTYAPTTTAASSNPATTATATTAVSITTVASQSTKTSVTTTTSPGAVSTSSTPSATTSTAPTTPDPCDAIDCPDGQDCGVVSGVARCLCSSSGSPPVNGTCQQVADPVVVKGVLIGLLVGSGAAVVAAGAALLLGGGSAAAAAAAAGPGAAAAAAGGGIAAVGSANKGPGAEGMELVESGGSSMTSYPTGKKAMMTLRSSPAYSSLANDTYVTISSTIPSS